MHSYGGLPTQDAVYDLDLPTRLAAGQSGGVIRLVYLAAFIGDQGESLADIRADQKSGWIAIDEHSRTATPTVPHEVFYHDVPPALAQTAASSLRPHSVATFHCRLARPAPWKRIPTTYIVCEDDHATPAAKQDAMIERVRRDPLCKLDTVERVGASHSPFLSVPGWVSGAVRRACGEDVKEV
ncbi:hypothetical protein B0J12DRAFT_662410 [Macrophomina phaseolina]|uniref:AB hydrolase-1 domain-containing protein n=1 Tax=Macrophomina phaseolina TaxID=35725 RepID=A0ABQ8GBW1_9PEZI|nr:hypothetical protein B0J12DRAFT_662410 [Macrophomina phaseolina]